MTTHSGLASMVDRIVAYAKARRGYLAVSAVVLLVALGLSALHHLTRSIRLSDVRAAFMRSIRARSCSRSVSP